MSAMAGEKTTHLDDFLKEMDFSEVEVGQASSITDLRLWVENINRSMGGTR
jgi:hypothetical protein